MSSRCSAGRRGAMSRWSASPTCPTGRLRRLQLQSSTRTSTTWSIRRSAAASSRTRRRTTAAWTTPPSWRMEHELFQQGNAQGITFVASRATRPDSKCPSVDYLFTGGTQPDVRPEREHAGGRSERHGRRRRQPGDATRPAAWTRPTCARARTPIRSALRYPRGRHERVGRLCGAPGAA